MLRIVIRFSMISALIHGGCTVVPVEEGPPDVFTAAILEGVWEIFGEDGVGGTFVEFDEQGTIVRFFTENPEDLANVVILDGYFEVDEVGGTDLQFLQGSASIDPETLQVEFSAQAIARNIWFNWKYLPDGPSFDLIVRPSGEGLCQYEFSGWLKGDAETGYYLEGGNWYRIHYGPLEIVDRYAGQCVMTRISE